MRQERLLKQRGRSIGTILIAAFIICIVITAIIIRAIAIYFALNTQYEQSISQLESIATLKSAQISNILIDWQDDITLIGDRISPSLVSWIAREDADSSITSPFRAQLTEQLDTLESGSRTFQALYVLSVDGDILANAGNPDDEPVDFSTFDYFRRGLSNTAIESVQLLPNQDEAAIWILHPITLLGNRIGILAGKISFFRLNLLMQQRAGLAESMETYLVDANGSLLTNSHFNQYEVGSTTIQTEAVTSVVADHMPYYGSHTSYHGEKSVVVAHWLPELRIIMVAEVVQTSIYDNFKQTIPATFTTTLLSTLFIIIFSGWAIRRWLVKPLRDLAIAAESISAGHYDQKVTIRSRNEIGVLAETFNTMSGQIKKTMIQLSENEARFRSMIESLPLGILAVKQEHDQLLLETCNPSFRKLFQLDDPEIQGKPIAEVLPFINENLKEHLNNTATQGDEWQGEISKENENVIEFSSEVYVFQTNPGRVVAAFVDSKERKEAEIERQRLQQEIIEAQKAAIKELSTPIIPLMDGIIVMPLIGSIDTNRARDIMRALLAGISEHRVKIVIIDITGVPMVDTGVAAHLDSTIQAARLKGTNTIITGVSDAVAETIVDLGVEWNNVQTVRDLQTGLELATQQLQNKQRIAIIEPSKAPNGQHQNGNGHYDYAKLRTLLEKFKAHKS